MTKLNDYAAMGRVLGKTEQKSINGGGQNDNCASPEDCYDPTVEDDGSGCYRIWGCEQSKCVLLEIRC